MKAQKKPVNIDYFIFNDFKTDLPHIHEWLESFNQSFINHFEIKEGNLYVKTSEGTSYIVTNQDVIIRGVEGEYYPCKKDIFYKTYNLI